MVISIEELKAKSGLPGPRGNLELLHLYLRDCSSESVADCLSEISPDTSNSPEEFVGMCGVVGFALLNWNETEALVRHLKKYSVHASWRIRESVAIAIQEAPLESLEERLMLTRKMEDNDPLICRAIVAGLCEPRNLKRQTGEAGLFSHLSHATSIIEKAQRLTDADRSLRKALGYCWSVALSDFFESGRNDFERLLNSPNKNLRWIVHENLKKSRLVKTNENWVIEMRRLLTSSST